MAKARVPWPGPMVPQDVEQMPAFGSSKMVKVPSGARRKPCRALLASRVNPVIAPARLMAKATVPWLAAVPAPGASNLVMVVFVPAAFTERPSPNVQRTRQSAIDRRGYMLDVQTDLKILVKALVFIGFVVNNVLTKHCVIGKEASNDQIALKRLTSFACRGNQGL